ncbi:hypothetical protein GCM10020331_004950 [Ectobacillus funiculus]
MLKEEIEKKLVVGSPEEGSTVVPLIDEQSADFVQGLIEDAIKKRVQPF